MKNLLLSANVVLPLMVMLLTGWLLRKRDILDDPSAMRINRVVFNVGLPCLCFKSLYEADLSSLTGLSVLVFVAVGIVISYIITFLLVRRFCSQNNRRGVLIQGIFRSNDAIFGIPVAIALLGEDRVALMSLTVAMTVIMYNMLGVVAMEVHRDGDVGIKKVLLQIAKHPIIWGCVLGLAVNGAGIVLPNMLINPIKSFGAMCTPLAFLALGGTLSIRSIQKNRRALTVVAAAKLLLLPGSMILPAILCGFRGEALVIVMTIFGAPTAVASFSMAAQAGADVELAGEIVAITAALSMLTMFLWIFVLKQTGVM